MHKTRNGTLCEIIQPRQVRIGKVATDRKGHLLEYVYVQIMPAYRTRFEWVREDNLEVVKEG